MNAADILSSAKNLRNSEDSIVKTRVYVNADLTPAEAQAAFDFRVSICAHRKRRNNTNREENGVGVSGMSVLSGSASH